MIKASALLVVVAIGLLVAGVLASSLLMVYVSIGVCAVAALLLAVGVFSHWSEIFGRREARPASTQGIWSEPQVHVTGPVLASLQAVAAARASGRPGSGEADVRSGGERSHDHPAEADQPQAEGGGRIDGFRTAGRSEDLWERVEEELGSAAKRDTGALSWPGIAFPPVPPDLPVPSESAAPATETGPQSEPRVGASAWIWGAGAGWQPPESPEGAWPPPAAAFAEPQASTEQASPEPASAEVAGNDAAQSDAAKTEVAGSASAGARRTAWDSPRKPVPETATDPVPDAESAPLSPDSETAGTTPKAAPGKPAGEEPACENAAAEKPAPDDAAAGEPAADKPAVEDRADQEPADQEPASHAADAEEPADQGGRPQGITPAPVVPDPAVPSAAATDAVVTESAVSESPAEDAEAGGTGDQDPQAQDSASEDSDLQDSGLRDSEAQDSEAQDSEAEDAGAGRPAADGPAAPEPPAADEPAAKPPAGQVEVTVVPGVARYHRSECILIRFLGAGDLEIMTRQEAEEAKFAACRACQPDQLEV